MYCMFCDDEQYVRAKTVSRLRKEKCLHFKSEFIRNELHVTPLRSTSELQAILELLLLTDWYIYSA